MSVELLFCHYNAMNMSNTYRSLQLKVFKAWPGQRRVIDWQCLSLEYVFHPSVNPEFFFTQTIRHKFSLIYYFQKIVS